MINCSDVLSLVRMIVKERGRVTADTANAYCDEPDLDRSFRQSHKRRKVISYLNPEKVLGD